MTDSQRRYLVGGIHSPTGKWVTVFVLGVDDHACQTTHCHQTCQPGQIQPECSKTKIYVRMLSSFANRVEVLLTEDTQGQVQDTSTPPMHGRPTLFYRRVAIAQVVACAPVTRRLRAQSPVRAGIGLWRFISRPSTLEAVYLSWLAWPRKMADPSRWLGVGRKRTTENDKLPGSDHSQCPPQLLIDSI